MLSMEKKLELWEKELPQDKIVLLAYLAKKTKDEEVTKELDKQMAAINNGLTTSIRSALFELYNFNMEEIEQVILKSNEYLKEKEKFLEKWGKDFMEKIKELEPKIKEEILNLIKGSDPKKINRLEIVKRVQKKFEIPLDNANEIFLMVKETEFPQSSNQKHTPKKYLKQSANNESKEDIKNQPISEQKEASNVITPKEENKSVEKQIDKQKERLIWLNNKFKPTKFQGTWHNYEKVDEGLKIGVQVFKDVKEYEELKNEKIEELKKQIDAINSEAEEVEAAFEYLNMR